MKHKLFPPIEPYSTGFLDVDAPHSLYWEQSGNPDGVPILFVHGGPGVGSSPGDRCLFDPEHYRIVLLDQRGSGKSHPLGTLENNTPSHLVADMEALRKQLNIKRWHLYGGSWGSTLSLIYAQHHPDRCISLILYSIFLCNQTEIDWFVNDMGRIFPEAYERFISPIPKNEREDILRAYYTRLTSADESLAIDLAQYWARFEESCMYLIPPAEQSSPSAEERIQNLPIARMEAHYFLHHVIEPENSLLKNVDKIRHIPATIIHGRYDMVCPIETAYKLHKAWPEADYIIVPDSGHSSANASMLNRLIEATENAKTIR